MSALLVQTCFCYIVEYEPITGFMSALAEQTLFVKCLILSRLPDLCLR